jgi:glutamate dehydrogenase/leucine dehydrogenase
VTTGQDLGHGLMSDGATPSLAYMHARFEGSVLADTSKPTAEGNFHLLAGMLEGCGVPLAGARVALLGAGNIGRHLLGRLRAAGAEVTALEPNAGVRAALAGEGVEALPVERKRELLARPVHAVVVNGAGGSLDAESVRTIAANGAVRVVCGSENLAMPDPADEHVLLAAGKVYAHTELGGMMGYLTAAEEYLARVEGVPFDVGTLYAAAERLHAVGARAAARVVAGGYRESFQEAARGPQPR